MSGFSLGKIFGIHIQIDWSWLLIFALVSWSLSTTFAQLHPGWAASTQWMLALAGALLFFASVLAHELSHSLMARARGVPVRNITLFLFGGVSNIQKEPASPASELLVAIVGPLTSFVLGVLFLILGVGKVALSDITHPAAMLSQLAPLNTLFLWLGSVNIILAVFNMLPGFPLDGGRVLRSVLWAATDNLPTATRWASWVGQGLAWGLILAGVAMLFGVRVPFLGSGLFNGIWIIFIGWFLRSAAAQTYRKVAIQDMLEDVPVKNLMYSEVPSAPAGITVESLVDDYAMHTDNRAFMVFDAGRMIGMVTLDDVEKIPPEKRAATLVRDIMTPSRELIVVAPEEKASDALNRLENQDLRQLPVVTGDRIVGMLRQKDILRWLELHKRGFPG
ncbi:MAG: site-2 protease family protein [Bacteroidota bacterium]